MLHSGVAAQEGSIREGDQVLSINGTSLCNCLHWEALRVLRRAKTRNLGVVVLRRGGISSACKGEKETDNSVPTLTQFTETGPRLYFTLALSQYSKSLAFKSVTVFSYCCCFFRSACMCASGKEQQGPGLQPGGRCGLLSGEQTTHSAEDLPGLELTLHI